VHYDTSNLWDSLIREERRITPQGREEEVLRRHMTEASGKHRVDRVRAVERHMGGEDNIAGGGVGDIHLYFS
jgi:hypothetical protein